MVDHLAGCTSIVKRPYSSMSLTLHWKEILKQDVISSGLEGLLAIKTWSFWDFYSVNKVCFPLHFLCERQICIAIAWGPRGFNNSDIFRPPTLGFEYSQIEIGNFPKFCILFSDTSLKKRHHNLKITRRATGVRGNNFFASN